MDIRQFSFTDQLVRVVMIDGDPWFVLADLATVLGISDVSRLRSRLDDGVRQTHPIVDSLGREQQATVVSEAGMYEVVIFQSRKPEARDFKRWITADVLPTIRKTVVTHRFGPCQHYTIYVTPRGVALIRQRLAQAKALV